MEDTNVRQEEEIKAVTKTSTQGQGLLAYFDFLPYVLQSLDHEADPENLGRNKEGP